MFVLFKVLNDDMYINENKNSSLSGWMQFMMIIQFLRISCLKWCFNPVKCSLCIIEVEAILSNSVDCLVLLDADCLINMLAMLAIALQMHELAMKLALQKSQNTELRSQFEGQ